MPEQALPDEEWCHRTGARLADDEAIRAAMKKIGRPLFLKLKQDDEGAFVIVRLAAAGDGGLTLDIHEGATVEEDGLIVSMTLDTWRRLLSGSLDIATGLMGRDVKAKGSMFELMRIADPAEEVVKGFARAQQQDGGR